MIRKLVVISVVTSAVISMVGCNRHPVIETAYGPVRLPAYCTRNKAATKAIVGGLTGAGIGATVGREHGRGAAKGAASEASLGHLSAAQADEQCRALAYRQAAQMALAGQAAAAGKGAPPPTEYEMRYVTPSNGVSHTVHVTHLSNRTKAASGSGSSCVTVSDGTAEKRLCQTADGKMSEP